MPDPNRIREADFGVFLREILLEQLLEGLRFRAALFELDPGVEVFGILPEDDHIHVFGVLYRGGQAREPAHRALADVQVQVFAQGHVQGADPAADRGGQRAFDPDQIFPEGLDGLLRQPAAEWSKAFCPA